MNTKTKIILFLTACIGSRFALYLFSTKASPKNLKYIGYVTFLMSLGFAIMYLFNLKGFPVDDKKIWWSDLRAAHFLNYFLFANYALQGSNKGSVFLLIDVIVGFAGFLNKYLL